MDVFRAYSVWGMAVTQWMGGAFFEDLDDSDAYLTCDRYMCREKVFREKTVVVGLSFGTAGCCAAGDLQTHYQ
jgi:hypothetical protein